MNILEFIDKLEEIKNQYGDHIEIMIDGKYGIDSPELDLVHIYLNGFCFPDEENPVNGILI